MYLTRLQAIKRWGDILEDHHEIYVWFFCARENEIITHVNNLLNELETSRETTKSPSHSEILDRTAALIDCHSNGLEFIKLSLGRLQIVRGVFKVDWQYPPKYTTEEINHWDIFFQSLYNSVLYVVSYFSCRPNFDCENRVSHLS